MKKLETPHISIDAKFGGIAKYVLMPGDPLRAKFMANKFLTNVQLVSSVRNILFYTGEYKNKKITIGASGMGQASIAIYAYELFKFYGVKVIIRVGTAGAYSSDLKLLDVINVKSAYATNNEFAQEWLKKDTHELWASQNIFQALRKEIIAHEIAAIEGTIHTSDIFYQTRFNQKEYAQMMLTQNHCLASEMESFALFAVAQALQCEAATLVTISDKIDGVHHDSIDHEARVMQTSKMFEIALDTLVQYHN